MDPLPKAFFRYLPLGPEAADWGVCVTAAGCTGIPADVPYPLAPHPSDHDFTWREGRILDEYQIIYITRGQGVFESRATGPRRVEAGTVLLLFPGVWHRYQPVRRVGWDEYWFALKGPQMDRLLERGVIAPERPLFLLGLNDVLLEEFVRIIETVESEPIGHAPLLAARALLVLAQVLAGERARRLGGSHIEQIVREARLAMTGQLDRPLDGPAMARQFHLSYAYFRRAFKEHTGLSPHQYHLQVRLNHARMLLQSTRLPIKAIAGRTGFDCPYYFSRIFKKKTGRSPAHFRALG